MYRLQLRHALTVTILFYGCGRLVGVVICAYVSLFSREFCSPLPLASPNANRSGDWTNHTIFTVRNSGYIVLFMLHVLHALLLILKYTYIYNIITTLKDAESLSQCNIFSLASDK